MIPEDMIPGDMIPDNEARRICIAMGNNIFFQMQVNIWNKVEGYFDQHVPRSRSLEWKKGAGLILWVLIPEVAYYDCHYSNCFNFHLFYSVDE